MREPQSGQKAQSFSSPLSSVKVFWANWPCMILNCDVENQTDMPNALLLLA
jgi:hypothetical protein